jgi:peptide/nickel transport system ATP-binding protein
MIMGRPTGNSLPLTSAPAQVGNEDLVLDVQDLSVTFNLRGGALKAVDGVSFSLRRGQTLCVVGESGSGKSVTARAILQLIAPPGQITSGRMTLHGTTMAADARVELSELDPYGREIRAIRGRDIAMVFQEPMAALSPVHTIGFQIDEALKLHTTLDKGGRRARTLELLRRVDIRDPDRTIDRYPFEYSGGMRQRACIAMALACNPRLLIADEPTTALDVTTQAEILDLLKELQREFGMAVLFITHDMGVVAEIADDVLVMWNGKAVERGPVKQIFHAAQHPYTRRLIGSVVKLEQRAALKPPLAPTPERGAKPILTLEGVSKRYTFVKGWFGRQTTHLDAVKDVSLTLYEGESLGIVGESGSGKTTLGRCILKLVPPTGGSVHYAMRGGAPVDIARVNAADMRAVNREVRMIFQDPFASLNPRMTVEQIIAEPLRNNEAMSTDQMRAKVGDLLQAVGLKREHMERYPHAFSGGQRQRIGIARALAVDPRLIIADEATSALDVSIRAQVLDLLIELQNRLHLSFLFISHDISVVRYFCDRVAVMRKGEVVEIGPTADVCDNPQHPYTKALLSAVPRPDPGARRLHQRHRYDESFVSQPSRRSP